MRRASTICFKIAGMLFAVAVLGSLLGHYSPEPPIVVIIGALFPVPLLIGLVLRALSWALAPWSRT
jgi:hypothetical protein